MLGASADVVRRSFLVFWFLNLLFFSWFVLGDFVVVGLAQAFIWEPIFELILCFVRSTRSIATKTHITALFPWDVCKKIKCCQLGLQLVFAKNCSKKPKLFLFVTSFHFFSTAPHSWFFSTAHCHEMHGPFASNHHSKRRRSRMHCASVVCTHFAVVF